MRRPTVSLYAVLAFSILRNGCAFFVPRIRPRTARIALRSKHRLTLEMASSDADGPAGLSNGRKSDDIWAQQKELAEEMTGSVDRARRAESNEQFAGQRLALLGDIAFFGFFIFCTLWTFFDNPFVAFSYSFGATLGAAYAYGLGRYVEAIGGGMDDIESMQGAGVGTARFAFLIILFIFVGKFRSVGLLEVPAISGFFTYQLATLTQGLRDLD